MAGKVLIVDDAPFIREVVKSALTKQGYHIVGEAASGEEAVSRVRELRPDIVLMDIVMPQMTGIEAAKIIQAEFPKTQLIAFSTISDETIVMQALDAGFSEYLVKPFKAEELIQVMESANAGGGQ